MTVDVLDDGYAVPAGHFDELREPSGAARSWWEPFTRHAPVVDAAGLTRAQARVAKEIHDSTITHTLYAAEGRQRPWKLDVLPHVISAADWVPLADAVQQHARLFNALAADLYGAQYVLREGLVAPGAVFGHAGFLRACHGVAAPGGVFLHQLAFDVARLPSGEWRIVNVRAQTPAGAGYAIENRAAILRLFPAAFREMQVLALAPYFATLRDTLARQSPCDGGPPRLVLLTPGPYSGRYFEHAYLARYFGFPLVEGADLTVRHDRLFLKTIAGLRQVHGVLRQLADDYCDPLELRADSALGVPGLVQAWRAGRVLMANAFGSGVLESPALRPFLPTIAERLLGEPLRGAAAPGDAADRQASYAPVWHDGRLDGRPLLLRAFAVADGRGDYVVMTGGLARVAAPNEPAVTSGSGGSKDTWVLSTTTLGARTAERRIAPRVAEPGGGSAITSRAAEHLFWLGRYVERADTSARLLRTALRRLSDPSAPAVQHPLFVRICQSNGLLDERDVEAAADGDAALLTCLVANITDLDERRSLGFNVTQAVRVAGAIRDRLSSDNWRLLNQLFGLFAGRPASALDLHDAMALLERSIVSLAAAAGIEIAHMRRDHGWRFLSLGRHLERQLSVAATFSSLEADERADVDMLEWLLDVSGSLVTFRTRHLTPPDWPAVVELLLFDAANPRALAFQIERIARHVPKLPGASSLGVVEDLVRLERTAASLDPSQLDLFGRDSADLDALLRECERVGVRLSEALTSKYFSHAYELAHAIGTGR